jgi:phosphopantetheinyl transferase
VAHDERGRPYIVPVGDAAVPWVSLSHSEGTVIALASHEPVGIDMEPLTRGTRDILSHFATDEEQKHIDDIRVRRPDEVWETRLWCAKEAVGTLLGIGLGGRPKDFQAVDIDEGGQLLILHVPTGHRFCVQTLQIDDMIVAYTSSNVVVAAAE